MYTKKFNIGDRVILDGENGVVRAIVEEKTEYPYRVSLDSWMDDKFLFLCKEEELEGIK